MIATVWSKGLRFLAFATFAFSLCGFSALPCRADALDAFKGQQGTLRIAGGTAHIPVMKEAAKRIMERFPNITITVAGGGSGVGIKQVGEGLVDIGNSGRAATADEIKRYGLVAYKWALDGVAIVVHPDNPVKRLSKDQIQAIFAGKIANWKAFGGADHGIAIYTRDAASGTRAVFWKKALNKGEISKNALFIPSNGAMKTTVANDPYAIGYVSVGHIDQSVAPVTLDGVPPSLDNVKSGAYTIARGLYSITKGKATGLAALFIDYLLSVEGQEIAANKGFIPVK